MLLSAFMHPEKPRPPQSLKDHTALPTMHFALCTQPFASGDAHSALHFALCTHHSSFIVLFASEDVHFTLHFTRSTVHSPLSHLTNRAHDPLDFGPRQARRARQVKATAAKVFRDREALAAVLIEVDRLAVHGDEKGARLDAAVG